MNIPDITIDYAPVAQPADRGSRRQAEHDSVMQLIRTRFGDDAVLLHDESGAPSVDGYDGHVSISHCRSLAALAIHPRLRIGIDIETERTQLLRIQNRYLTATEAAEFRSIRQLLWAWTAKEAVYKAAGIEGLPLTSIALDHASLTAELTGKDVEKRRFRLYSAFSDNIMTTVAVPL